MQRFENVIERVRNHELIQYRQGHANFMGYACGVEPGVLIPRTETGELVELIIKENKIKNPSILDIGTGSGCIAISLAKQIAHADVTAWDVSDEALRIARNNNSSLQTNVRFIKQDVLQVESNGLSATYDIIVSNPPYITPSEKREMEPNVLNWEPDLALFVPQEDQIGRAHV